MTPLLLQLNLPQAWSVLSLAIVFEVGGTPCRHLGEGWTDDCHG